MWAHNVCRVCLISGVKMYSCTDPNLRTYYEEITQTAILYQDNKPKNFCFECAALLKKCWLFIQKCQIANKFLDNISVIDNQITEKERSKMGLVSNLSKNWQQNSEVLINEIKDELTEFDEKEGDIDLMTSSDQIFKDDFYEISKEIEVFPEEIEDNWDSDDSKPIINNLLNMKRTKTKHKNDKPCIKVRRKTKYKRKKQINALTLERKKLAKIIKETTTLKVFSQEEVRQQMESKKELKSYINSKFKCEQCYKGVSTYALLSRHMGLTHDPKIGQYECDDCRHRFQDRKTLRKHWVAVHSRRYYCKECGHECNNSSQALEHQRNKHGDEKYECRHCGKKMSHRSTYYKHLRTAHTTEFVCELCGCEFESKKGLLNHKRLKHLIVEEISTENEISLSCEECLITFVGRKAYNTHMIRKHKSLGCKNCTELFYSEDNKNSHTCKRIYNRLSKNFDHASIRSNDHGYLCRDCGVQFVDCNSLAFHRTAVHSFKPRTKFKKNTYICTECKAVFSSHLDLARHVKYHTGQVMYSCTFCPLEFALKRELDAHMVTHAGAMPYLCSHCGNSYAKEIELKRHLINVESRRQCRVCGDKFDTEDLTKAHTNRMHPNVRPFKCTVCGKDFKASGHLTLHMSIHSGTKQYGCDRCGKKYRTNGTLRLHIMTVHMKMPDPYHRNDPLKRKRAKMNKATKV